MICDGHVAELEAESKRLREKEQAHLDSQIWKTLGGYEIVAGPIARPFGCIDYVVLNNDGCYDQLIQCKAFADGRISKRGESQYDLISI